VIFEATGASVVAFEGVPGLPRTGRDLRQICPSLEVEQDRQRPVAKQPPIDLCRIGTVLGDERRR
jgi:hypothetical protein